MFISPKPKSEGGIRPQRDRGWVECCFAEMFRSLIFVAREKEKA